jgi:AN1-type zinc finger protein 5/6
MGKKTRCSFCNKKTGLINFPCKCDGTYCSLHRYTHSHGCSYIETRKEEIKEEIIISNPKMKSTTLEKI